jgi:ferredoxin
LSRFRIRQRIKDALGQGPVEIVRHPVTYLLPDGTEQVVQAEEGYTLLMASEALPSPISTGRRAGGTCPDGRCGLCRVEVTDATGLSAMTDREQESLDAQIRGDAHEGRDREPGLPATETTRLACYVRIQGPGGRVQVDALVDFDALKGDPDGT